MEWDNRYRQLKKGETIRLTDEVRTDVNGGWKAAVCVGQKAPDPAYTSHRVYRRLVAATPAAGAAVDALAGGEDRSPVIVLEHGPKKARQREVMRGSELQAFWESLSRKGAVIKPVIQLADALPPACGEGGE